MFAKSNVWMVLKFTKMKARDGDGEIKSSILFLSSIKMPTWHWENRNIELINGYRCLEFIGEIINIDINLEVISHWE